MSGPRFCAGHEEDRPGKGEATVFLETIESKGLAHISYMLGDEEQGVAVVIDPRRDTDVYLNHARRLGVRITHVMETHIHADFVSGSTELAAATGAEIVGGANGDYGFPVRGGREGDVIRIGPKITIQVLDTPGHTAEHVCFLISGGRGSEEPWGLFTGDTLFAGEVGRPDLLGSEQEQVLAHQLYHTLFEKILKLGDEVEIYPAHGKGSPCGGSIGDRLTSTLGYERLHNGKFRAESEDEFVRMVLTGLPPAPTYYPRMKEVNARGPGPLQCLPTILSMDPRVFNAERRKENTLVVDTREIEAFGGAHIHGAMNIALRDEFPVWAGWMLLPDQRILLVLDRHDDLDQVQRHLLRIGIEKVDGFLRRGMRGWIEDGLDFVHTLPVSVHELKRHLDRKEDSLQILDVRNDGEWESGRIPTASHAFLGHLEKELDGRLDPEKPVLTYCGSGYRASIAASVLERMGFKDVRSLPGSMKAWKAAGFQTTDSGM